MFRIMSVIVIFFLVISKSYADFTITDNNDGTVTFANTGGTSTNCMDYVADYLGYRKSSGNCAFGVNEVGQGENDYAWANYLSIVPGKDLVSAIYYNDNNVDSVDTLVDKFLSNKAPDIPGRPQNTAYVHLYGKSSILVCPTVAAHIVRTDGVLRYYSAPYGTCITVNAPVVPPCTVTTPDLTIDLHTVNRSTFSGVGSAGGSEETKSLNMNCTASTPASVKISGTVSSDDPQLFSLDGGTGSATGIGIRIKVKDTVAVAEQSIPLGALTIGDNAVPFSAQYVQTQSVIKPGRANATLTYEMTFN